MADVYEAVPDGGEAWQRVCVKRITADDRDAHTLVAHEALLASRLAHPNIVRLLDRRHLQLPGVDGGSSRLSLIYELVDGATLEDVVRAAGGRLAPHVVAYIGREISAALGYAHSAGVLHRDVSPQNILVGRSGEVKLADFGIGKLMARAYVTESRRFQGKWPYVAPETFEGNHIDARSDIYSLGVVLHECAIGRHPYVRPDETVLAMMRRVQGGERESLEVGYDSNVGGVIDRMTDGRRDERQTSAEEVEDAFDDLAAGGRKFLRILVSGMMVSRPGPESMNESVGDVATTRAPRLLAAALGLVALGAVGVAATSFGDVPPKPTRDLATHADAGARDAGAPTATSRDASTAHSAQPASASRAEAPPAPSATGVLRVSVIPRGSIAIDGRFAGEAPADVVVAAGRHTVTAWLMSNRRDRSVRVVGGRTTAIAIDLTTE